MMFKVMLTALLLNIVTEVFDILDAQIPEVIFPLGAEGEKTTTGATENAKGKVQVTEEFAATDSAVLCVLLSRLTSPVELCRLA